MTLELYLLRQLLVATLFASGALAFVVFPAIAVTAVHKLGGVGLGAVATYIPMVAIGLLPYLLSLGFLLAVVSTFGRLAADNEWIALTMAGVHPLRTLLPGALLAVVLGAGTYLLLAEVSPRWKLEQNNFRHTAVMQAFRSLAPGRTEIDLPGFYIGAVGRDGAAFIDAQVRVPSDDGGDMVIVADRVELSFDENAIELELHEARTVAGDGMFAVGGMTIVRELDDLLRPKSRDPNKPSHRSSASMRRALRDGSAPAKWAGLYVFEIHQRYALSVIFGLFLMIGVPTGMWLRSGTQLVGLGVAAIYAFVYYIVSMRLGRELADSGAMPPALAAWTTNIAGLVVGAVAMVRMVRR